MNISIFDLFSIGIGPSSSHTVGPMKAAFAFVQKLHSLNALSQVQTITVELFGSLAFTGKGHGTDHAILMGLEGETPEKIIPNTMKPRCDKILKTQQLNLYQKKMIYFDYTKHLIFNFEELLPAHTNGLRFSAYNQLQENIIAQIFYSIGGGFILTDEEIATPILSPQPLPFTFNHAHELLSHCHSNHLSIKDVMLHNECVLKSEMEVKQGLLEIAHVMHQCIKNGCHTEGILPGGMHITRRAPALMQKLQLKGQPKSYRHADSIAWLNLFAIAVNEENAAGGRVVTAPTNGAAGIIPAVLYYYLIFYPDAKLNDAIDFLLTAGAIGILYKKGASISGAEVGCQGEVGVASSMAAGALTALLGGTLDQIENAAEIAMEHHLGMTCDPINGLVQIPCIERNAMGAVKAVNAANLALLGNGTHYVSLDKVIATMKQTGKDMMSIYKETSQGGLAANLPEC